MYTKSKRRGFDGMLTAKERQYDDFVTSGGSDKCFQNGMWGHCGFDCTVFGCKPECFDGATEEQLIEAYNEGLQTDAIYSYFEDNDMIDKLKLNEVTP